MNSTTNEGAFLCVKWTEDEISSCLLSNTQKRLSKCKQMKISLGFLVGRYCSTKTLLDFSDSVSCLSPLGPNVFPFARQQQIGKIFLKSFKLPSFGLTFFSWHLKPTYSTKTMLENILRKK